MIFALVGGLIGINALFIPGGWGYHSVRRLVLMTAWVNLVIRYLYRRTSDFIRPASLPGAGAGAHHA